MVPSDKHQMIRHAVLRRPDAVADNTAHLWQTLSDALVAIIGEGGFQSLYARSAHLCLSRYTWLAAGQGPGFIDLRDSLAKQEPTKAAEASVALLTIFIDTLILLIGELLTTSILRSAWGDDAVNTAGKETQ